MANEIIMGQIMGNQCWCGRKILQRIEVPQRRHGENFEFTHDGQKFHASVRYASVTALDPLEIFLNGAKADSAVDLAARDAAILVSIALQYGVPLNVLSHAMGKNPDGSPSSPVGQLLAIMAKEQQQ